MHVLDTVCASLCVTQPVLCKDISDSVKLNEHAVESVRNLFLAHYLTASTASASAPACTKMNMPLSLNVARCSGVEP